MAIATYADLVTAITTNFLHRTDLSAVAPDFILLAEDKFNLRLRTFEQETALAATAIDSSYQVAVPANTRAIKRIWRTDDPKTPLMAATLDTVILKQGDTSLGTSGLARQYCREGSTWRFDGTGTVAGVLYRTIPALSGSNTTNWLLTSYPGVYLWACLAEAATYIGNHAQAQAWEAKADARIDEMNRRLKQDEFSGPLRMRAA